MIRLVALAVAAVLVLTIAIIALDAARTRVPKRLSRQTPRERDYDWEHRRHRVYRRVKAVPAPREDRDRILAFLESRAGVEAFVEPRTVMHPLSAVFVAEDGEWIRIELRDDGFLRELTRTRSLRVHDAMRVGYPERMRRYRRADGDAGPEREGA